MTPSQRFPVFGVLVNGIHYQVALVVLRIQLNEQGFVFRKSGVALVDRGFQHQVAVHHIQGACGDTNGIAQHAITGTAARPFIGQSDVGAIGVVRHRPATRRHAANSDAAIVFVADSDIFFVPNVRIKRHVAVDGPERIGHIAGAAAKALAE